MYVNNIAIELFHVWQQRNSRLDFVTIRKLRNYFNATPLIMLCLKNCPYALYQLGVKLCRSTEAYREANAYVHKKRLFCIKGYWQVCAHVRVINVEIS